MADWHQDSYNNHSVQHRYFHILFTHSDLDNPIHIHAWFAYPFIFKCHYLEFGVNSGSRMLLITLQIIVDKKDKHKDHSNEFFNLILFDTYDLLILCFPNSVIQETFCQFSDGGYWKLATHHNPED